MFCEPYQQSFEAVLAALETDPRHGLSEAEAQARLGRLGPNELIPEAETPAWRKFLAQFGDVLVILLLFAAAVSFGLWLLEHDSALPYEAIAILAIVLLNAVMGYVQESRAESALAALRNMSAARANVIREGERRSVRAVEIVPGDIIVINEGDTIPADGRLIQVTELQTAEAPLTGESLPVSKDTDPLAGEPELGDRHNMIFSGTAATYGHGKAVVTATGMQTEMGHIAGMLKEAPKESTPLQKELDKVGKRLGLVVIVIAAFISVTIILVEHVRGLSMLFDVLLLGVALAVAAVPEGLPAVVTAVLALGVQRMARRHAIVRHLPAVETLGSATVIASDKTGTLTKNEMTVRTVLTASGRVNFTGTGYAPEGDVFGDASTALDGPLRGELQRALTVADRANNALLQKHDGRWTVQGDPSEGALLVAARKAGLDAETLGKRFERVGELPFSSERKLMSTIHKDANEQERVLVFTKGAPEVLVMRCSQEMVGEETRALSDKRRTKILRTAEDLASQEIRTLRVAARRLPANALQDEAMDAHLEHVLIFLGLIGLIDPPRDEARRAVDRAKRAGIRPIMITGDHPKTAATIAAELGIASKILPATGADLDNLSDKELAAKVRQISVYARVNPEHKLRIVKALQHSGETVAMTGDGVNDAPALQTADIGVAMGLTGTDVAKQASDVVLTDDNFATIVAAVEEGRAIFANIRKFLLFLLSSNIGEVMAMFFGVLLAKVIGLRTEGSTVVMPLLATQILWVNLVTDGAPALALGVEPVSEGLMEAPPRPRGEGVVTHRMWVRIFFIGAIIAAGTLLVFDASLPGGLIPGSGNLRYAQTMAFTTLVLFELLNVFNARSDTESAFRGFFRNAWLWGALGLSLALQIAVIYTPFLQRAFSTVSLSLVDWMRCTAVASSVLWLCELSKCLSRATTSQGGRG